MATAWCSEKKGTLKQAWEHRKAESLVYYGALCQYTLKSLTERLRPKLNQMTSTFKTPPSRQWVRTGRLMVVGGVVQSKNVWNLPFHRGKSDYLQLRWCYCMQAEQCLRSDHCLVRSGRHAVCCDGVGSHASIDCSSLHKIIPQERLYIWKATCRCLCLAV